LAGKIIADIIEAPYDKITLNVGNTVVASMNASGLYTSTGNLLITQANSIGTSAIEDGAVTNAKLTLTSNASAIKTALNASGDPGIYACRAWVNFNGTSTPAIREDGNVSSITDNGTGDYEINFTTAMPDANYAAMGDDQGHTTMRVTDFNTTNVRIRIDEGGIATDQSIVCVAIFR
jgi:hypothetical protein